MGSAALLGSEDAAGEVSVGTLAWAAPEVLAGGAADAKVSWTAVSSIGLGSCIDRMLLLWQIDLMLHMHGFAQQQQHPHLLHAPLQSSSHRIEA